MTMKNIENKWETFNVNVYCCVFFFIFFFSFFISLLFFYMLKVNTIYSVFDFCPSLPFAVATSIQI